MKSTIKDSAEISHLFSCGKRYSSSAITLMVLKNEAGHDPQGRVAFIAGKKMGNAVWRNSAKRRMREIAHEVGAPWPGYDVIFLAKRSILEQPFAEVLKSCKTAVQKAKLQ